MRAQLSLAAAQGNNEAARCRDKIVHNMTPEQIDEAQTLATTWKPMTPEEFEKHNEEIIEREKRAVAYQAMVDLGFLDGTH